MKKIITRFLLITLYCSLVSFLTYKLTYKPINVYEIKMFGEVVDRPDPKIGTFLHMGNWYLNVYGVRGYFPNGDSFETVICNDIAHPQSVQQMEANMLLMEFVAGRCHVPRGQDCISVEVANIPLDKSELHSWKMVTVDQKTNKVKVNSFEKPKDLIQNSVFYQM